MVSIIIIEITEFKNQANKKTLTFQPGKAKTHMLNFRIVRNLQKNNFMIKRIDYFFTILVLVSLYLCSKYLESIALGVAFVTTIIFLLSLIKTIHMNIKAPNYTQQPHQMPVILRFDPKNRSHKRPMMKELLKNLNHLKPIEDEFVDKVFNTVIDYEVLYNSYLARYKAAIHQIKFRYTKPNPDYFEKNYKPEN